MTVHPKSDVDRVCIKGRKEGRKEGED